MNRRANRISVFRTRTIHIVAIAISCAFGSSCVTNGDVVLQCEETSPAATTAAEVSVIELAANKIADGTLVRASGYFQLWVDRLMLFDTAESLGRSDYSKAIEVEIPKCLTKAHWGRLVASKGERIVVIGTFESGSRMSPAAIRPAISISLAR